MSWDATKKILSLTKINNMETTIEHFHSEIEKPKRSQLLTVLCVLSFIMCAFTIISTVMSIAQDSPESHQ